MSTYVLATANLHKAQEMREVLAPFGLTLLARPEHVAEVEESETTLGGNALLKARALMQATNTPAIADDTGLFVDALGGRPGVYSARYAGQGATYADNVAKLLRELVGIDESARTASFRTVVAVAYPSGHEFWVDATLSGRILDESRGLGGFGYDSLFVPDESDGRTLAQLSADEKNALSHRGRALRAVAGHLKK